MLVSKESTNDVVVSPGLIAHIFTIKIVNTIKSCDFTAMFVLETKTRIAVDLGPLLFLLILPVVLSR